MPIVLMDTPTSIVIRDVPSNAQLDHIPPYVYRPHFNRDGIDLEKLYPNFKTPTKLYGDHAENRDIIWRDFLSENDSMGVMLSGKRGSGKSVLAEDLCNNALKLGLPVVRIDQQIPVFMLYDILKVCGPCVLYFDEFGKIYHKSEDRNELLTLFSDRNITKTLFIVTGNKLTDFNDHMLMRPGRFRYNVAFDGIAPDVLEAVLTNAGLNEDIKTWMTEYVSINEIPFDILMNVLKLTCQIDDLPTLIQRIKLLNVPSPPVITAVIKTVEIETFNREDNSASDTPITIGYSELCSTGYVPTAIPDNIHYIPHIADHTFSTNERYHRGWPAHHLTKKSLIEQSVEDGTFTVKLNNITVRGHVEKVKSSDAEMLSTEIDLYQRRSYR